jgi:molybdopterin/thiamine biosynthesis adenylyltransferase
MLNKLQKNEYSSFGERYQIFNTNEEKSLSSENQSLHEMVLKYKSENSDLKQEIEALRKKEIETVNVDMFSTILQRINSRMDDLSYEPLDKDDFESIFNQLDYLDTKLDKMEKNYEVKINELKAKFEFVNNKTIQQLSKKITSVKANDPEITLHFQDTDLEKIEHALSNKKTEMYNFYSLTRVVVIGVIGMVGLLMYEPFWNIYKELLVFLGLM